MDQGKNFSRDFASGQSIPDRKQVVKVSGLDLLGLTPQQSAMMKLMQAANEMNSASSMQPRQVHNTAPTTYSIDVSKTVRTRFRGSGTVTTLRDDFGFVNEEIYFHSSSVDGRMPKVGETVMIDCEFIDKSPHQWTATFVKVLPFALAMPSKSLETGKPALSTTAPKITPSDFQKTVEAPTSVDSDKIDLKTALRLQSVQNNRSAVPIELQDEINQLKRRSNHHVGARSRSRSPKQRKRSRSRDCEIISASSDRRRSDSRDRAPHVIRIQGVEIVSKQRERVKEIEMKMLLLMKDKREQEEREQKEEMDKLKQTVKEMEAERERKKKDEELERNREIEKEKMERKAREKKKPKRGIKKNRERERDVETRSEEEERERSGKEKLKKKRKEKIKLLRKKKADLEREENGSKKLERKVKGGKEPKSKKNKRKDQELTGSDDRRKAKKSKDVETKTDRRDLDRKEEELERSSSKVKKRRKSLKGKTDGKDLKKKKVKQREKNDEVERKGKEKEGRESKHAGRHEDEQHVYYNRTDDEKRKCEKRGFLKIEGEDSDSRSEDEIVPKHRSVTSPRKSEKEVRDKEGKGKLIRSKDRKLLKKEESESEVEFFHVERSKKGKKKLLEEEASVEYKERETKREREGHKRRERHTSHHEEREQRTKEHSEERPSRESHRETSKRFEEKTERSRIRVSEEMERKQRELDDRVSENRNRGLSRGRRETGSPERKRRRSHDVERRSRDRERSRERRSGRDRSNSPSDVRREHKPLKESDLKPLFVSWCQKMKDRQLETVSKNRVCNFGRSIVSQSDMKLIAEYFEESTSNVKEAIEDMYRLEGRCIWEEVRLFRRRLGAMKDKWICYSCGYLNAQGVLTCAKCGSSPAE